MDYSAMLKEFEYRVRLKMINLYHKKDVASWDKFAVYERSIKYSIPGRSDLLRWEDYKRDIGGNAYEWRATAEAYEELYHTLLEIEKAEWNKEREGIIEKN